MGRNALRIMISIGLVFTVINATNVPATFAQPTLDTFVYHQITNLTEGSGYLGFPVLSADGTTAVFSDAPGTGDPATPNRIYTIHADGSGLEEVDSYVPLCFCNSSVDISNDGSVVISTDAVQLRIADAGGVRGLITLTSNEITAISITGDGRTVYFLIRRDAALLDSGELVPRGIWAIDTSGQNLRQLVSAEDVALATGVPIEQTGCCFHADGHPLDVSPDGGRIIFGAYAGTGEHVFTADGNGGSLAIVREAVTNVMRVAISGDGSTLAYDVIAPETNMNEVGVVASGGEAAIMPGVPNGGFEEPIQLSEDGSLLLVSPSGLLFDTVTGDVTTLAVSIPNAGGSHEAVLTDGLARATMDSAGQEFLYVMRTVRCADCVNLQEQLATMEINPADLGASPEITDATVDPTTIGLAGASSTTAQATIVSNEETVGVGIVALLDGLPDINIGNGPIALLDAGTNGDRAAGDGTFAAAGIAHSQVMVRENDTGERIVRFAAESATADGMRHATAVDAGTLTVAP